MNKSRLTIGEAARRGRKLSVHCRDCSRLQALDVASLKLPGDTTLVEAERAHVRCAGCGSRAISLKMSDEMR